MNRISQPYRCDGIQAPAVTRRDMLRTLTTGFGYMAFAGIASGAASADKSLLLPRQPHFAARAKRVIFLAMEGAVSHVDTFEYKPQLTRDDGKAGNGRGDSQFLGSPFSFAQYGNSGQWVSELFPNVAQHTDELCFLRGMWTDAPPFHPQAFAHLHTGSALFVRPSMGSWVLYGLGTENQNLPGFITIKPPLAIGGAQSYGSAFLPAVFQASRIGESKTKVQNCSIGNIANPHFSAGTQRDQIDLVQAFNNDLKQHGNLRNQVEGVIESFELAYRMQAEVPDVTDLTKESPATLAAYGIGSEPTDDFGRQCLLARRFAEAGVRFIEVCYDDWDHHQNLRTGLKKSCAATDKPIAALLQDLRERGLLEDTLVLWGSEFGRTIDPPKRDGRDHNAKGYTMWMAGGGVKPGFSYGAQDEHGAEAVEGKMDHHDLHATILHALGLDHEKLTYRYAGRDFRLTDVKGNVHKEIFA